MTFSRLLDARLRQLAVVLVAIGLLMFASAERSDAVGYDGLAYHRLLPIPPVTQDTENSCWLAVAEMILRYFDVPVDTLNLPKMPKGFPDDPLAHVASPQCHIYLITVAPKNGKCAPTSESVVQLQDVMNLYPVALRQWAPIFFGRQQVISSTVVTKALKQSEIEAAIDLGHPIGAVVNFPGTTHIVLIVGYDRTSAGFMVTINDPYPYKVLSNPWLSEGALSPRNFQYSVLLSAVNRIASWQSSITGFSTTSLPGALQKPDKDNPDAYPTRVVLAPLPFTMRSASPFGVDTYKLINAVRLRTLTGLPKRAGTACNISADGGTEICTDAYSLYANGCETIVKAGTTLLSCLIGTGVTDYRAWQKKLAGLLPDAYQLEAIDASTLASEISGLNIWLRYSVAAPNDVRIEAQI